MVEKYQYKTPLRYSPMKKKYCLLRVKTYKFYVGRSTLKLSELLNVT